jgi:acetate kinase
LWNVESERKKLCDGIVERVTLKDSFIKHRIPGNEELIIKHECPNHEEAIALMVKTITDSQQKIINSMSEISAVGHRVVHGGEKISSSKLIDNEVLKVIEECSKLAPLHNPPNLFGIKASMKLMPDIPQIAVFDTAFFTKMPPSSYMYALPYEWFEKYHIKKYGFHGTSHLYVSKRAAVLLGKKYSECNLITLHVGNGTSITAIKNGEAFDHSMGFTPLEGAIMGTRCGDIDPAIPLHVMELEGLTPSQMSSILNKKSGLAGICNKADRREILKAREEGDVKAKLAFDMECYRLKKYIGAYTAALGRLDAIVFTAGVGENSFTHREAICSELDLLGVKIDPQKNIQAVGRKKENDISSKDSKVKVFVIPTDEELVFLEDVMAIVKGQFTNNYEHSFERDDFCPSFS